MITETYINNAPYRMLPYHGKLLVAIGNTVRNKKKTIIHSVLFILIRIR